MTATATPPRSAALKEYLAHDNGDGSFTIADVEIVGPMPEGDKPDGYGEAPATDAKWMRRVVGNHLAQLVGGFVAPVHDAHSSDRALGTFVPTSVRKVRYEGDEIDVLFGDLTVDAATLAAIRRGEYPYRSIEVSRWNDARVTSLALMKASGPYWRFPMLKSVRVVGAEAMPDPTSSPDLASLWAVTDTPRVKGFRDVSTRVRARELARLSAYTSEAEREEAPTEDGDEPTAEKPKDGPPAKNGADGDGLDDGDGEDKTASALATLIKLVTKIASKILGGGGEEDRLQPAKDEDPNTSGKTEVDDEDGSGSAGEPKEKAKMAAANATLDAGDKATLAALSTRVTTLETSNATLAAENATLKADLAASKSAAACTAFAAKAHARLRAKRVIVPQTLAADLSRLWAVPAQGEALAEAHVASLEANGRTDPPETFLDEIASASTVGDEPELAPYRQGSPAQLEAALGVARQYRALKAQSPGSTTTLAEMLKINAPLARA